MDRYRTLVGIVSLVAGIFILSKLLTVGPNPVAIVTGAAFLGFGIYRLGVANQRYRQYRLLSVRRQEKHGN